MRILYEVARIPTTLDTGGQQRTFHMARALAASADLTVLGYAASQQRLAFGDDPGGPEVVRLPLDASGPSPREIATGLVSPTPVVIRRYRTRQWEATEARLLRARPFDAVLYDSQHIWPRRPPPGPALLHAHNVQAVFWRRFAAEERRPLHRLYLELQRRRMEAFERSAMRQVPHAVAVSPEDREALLALVPSADVVVSPNGTDVAALQPCGWELAEPNTVAFVGSFNWRPNADGAKLFVQRIWPLVRAAEPDAKFLIVGKDPPPDVWQLAGDGVHVTGTVNDVRPFYAAASVVVAPLTWGGGTRLKILEAMALGRPVVSTTLGAEGLALTPGADFLRADGPEAFAEHVVRLLRCPEEGKRLAAHARGTVERTYDWPACIQPVIDKLRELRA